MMNKYNGFKAKTIEKLFELGKEFASKNMDDYEVIHTLDRMGFRSFEASEIVFAGMVYGDRITIEEKTWYRIGEPTIDTFENCYKNSYNFADDKPENGISVVTSDWLNSMKSVFFGAHDSEKLKSRGVYKIKGVQIGFGGDDEPVIYATDWAEKTRIRTFTGLKKVVSEN